ncbi:MAG: PSD1 and planctomycete cytochrome C domain-containing protein [Aureliella sp.]
MALLILIAVAQPVALAEDAEAEALFVRRVAPLLQQKCLACHGGDPSDIQGGLDLRSRPALLEGGDSGQAAIDLDEPQSSPLYLAITRKSDDWSAMPPKEAEALSTEQIAWLEQWIVGGAPWPDEERTREIQKANVDKWSAEDGVAVQTSGGLSQQWTERKYKLDGLWAYQPVRKPTPPNYPSSNNRSNSSGRNPIDAFIDARMPAGLEPAPPADRLTLIRRATFDLTGLPPTPEEVEAFVHDALPDAAAFAKVVERLLDSRHFGERMAQHWLDVVRYADSSGFANDYERGNAWRYRDYVVRAFNADKPYDRFVREQLAGDEMPQSAEPGEKQSELLIATGFLRMGPWELTGMEVAKVARQRFLDDVTNSVGETFLAHSLQCARCHDHKFDPVPTRDYYALQAVFATTQLAERAAPFLPDENIDGFEEEKFLQMRREEHLATLARLDDQLLAAAQDWYRARGLDPAEWNAAVEKAASAQQAGKRREFKDVFSKARGLLLKAGVAEDQFPPKFVGFAPEDYGMERVARKGLERLRWELERYEPLALAVYNGRTPQLTSVNAPLRMPADRTTAGLLEETCILTGGDPFSPGTRVEPGVLSVLGKIQKTPIPEAIDGRRAALADWIASPDNPLTTRAIVNRIWLWHFGRAIATNPNNFGSTGGKPTHPELLDWLAATFVEKGWSFKAMHRVIMNSETYRRGAVHPDRDALAARDLSGTSYAVFLPRRLTAEELRDSMLAASGELNPALGGIPCRPEINLEAALQPRQVMGTFAAAWTPNPLPAQRHRRSLYTLKLRGLTDPLLEVFNAPAADFSCERREASTVTPQVFSLFNGQNSHARALALAHRGLKETGSDAEALARCFALAYSRPPNPKELQACQAHWRDIEALLREERAQSDNADSDSVQRIAKHPPLEVRREAVEENTGEKFSFTEKLHAYAEFVPDLQPDDVSMHTQALADVCLAIFNSNEFIYVY